MSGDKPGAQSRNWKGGRHVDKDGYIQVYMPHQSNGYAREHIVIAERALGKPLPHGAVIHHVDEDGANNAPNNLVICQDRGYHKILHVRMRALKACGHANWVKCEYCHQWDDPINMYVRKGRSGGYHNKCANEYNIKLLRLK